MLNMIGLVICMYAIGEVMENLANSRADFMDIFRIVCIVAFFVGITKGGKDGAENTKR